MADSPTGVCIVEIRAGNSQRPVLELRPGEPIQPMSIGRVGMWPIDAPGVLDVHAYVYFDGRVLFFQSADTANPAKGNGQAIGAAWQQVEIPCTIEIGRARLVYRTLEEQDEGDDKTVAQAIKLPTDVPAPPPPAPPAPAAPQFRPGGGAFSNRQQPDDEATRLAPMTREPDPTVVNPLEVTGANPPPKPRPAAGMPAAPKIAQPAPGWVAHHDGAPISATHIGPAPAAPVPPPPQTGYQAFGSVQVAVPAPPPPMMQPNMMGAPMMQPGMPMQPGPMQPGMPPGMAPNGAMPMMGGSGPYPQQMPMPGQPGAGPNAETARVQTPDVRALAKKAKAEWDAMPPIRKIIVGTFPGVVLLVYFMLFDDPPPPPPHPQHPVASVSVPTTTTAKPTATPPIATTAFTAFTASTTTGTAPIPTVTGVSTAPAPPASGSALPKGKKTPEREAIDLAAAGQYQKAAEIYDQLAAAHPEQPAYREAARLLRERINPP